ncbi:hypothetical protein MAR_011830 [Mya arenaria]|uniref:Uncharacterized protein n=1 Tax=Mya arenaria TaxID=6604 RepID=A0ABY7G4A8_MYAAR|nr:hypothetical protein MAR_011830 [Mya arenaria]
MQLRVTDTSTCYKQEALTFAVPPSVWTFCEGRKITVLEAIECEAELEQERDVIDESPVGLN